MAARSHETDSLRCFCPRRPLLAIVGVDEDGKSYLHVKVFKQGRVFGEVVALSGDISIRCRDCLRWHRVHIRRENVDFKVEDLPPEVAKQLL